MFHPDTFHGYVDNFDQVPTEEELKNADEEYGPVPNDGGENILPYAIIYLNADADEDHETNPLVFDDLEPEHISITHAELAGGLPMPEFIGVVDQYGDCYYIPANWIICLEVYNPLVGGERFQVVK